MKCTLLCVLVLVRSPVHKFQIFTRHRRGQKYERPYGVVVNVIDALTG